MPDPMIVGTPSNVTEVKAEHLLNAQLPILIVLAGIVIASNPLFSKAYLPIYLRAGKEGIVFSERQSLKALSPILINAFKEDKQINLFLPINAFFPIAITVSGM